jgi:SAM-dependent methyltransferase
MVTRYTEYDPFAWIYNRHWCKHTLQTFTPVIETLLLPDLLSGAQILDLCCGTGQITRWLTDHGYHVTGLDGSAAMLEFARENAPDAAFILADARSFSMPSTFQAVVSTFDSLNHLLSIEELTMAFRNVQTALAPGGTFLCDLNIRQGFLGRQNYGFSIVEDDNVCIVYTRYDDDTRLAYWDLTIFRLQQTWQRTDLTLTQRAYEEAEICQALTEAGFSNIQVFDAKRCPNGLASLPNGRAFFLAKKES